MIKRIYFIVYCVIFGNSTSKTRATRSRFWRKVRKEHLKKEPVCQYCGSQMFLEVHHIEPFHIRPDLELQDSNLITLCGRENIVARAWRGITGKKNCHLMHGHLGDYRKFNPNIKDECFLRKTHRKGEVFDSAKK